MASCDLVDTQLLAKAYQYLYSSFLPLGQYNAKYDGQLIDQCLRKVVHSSKVDWFGNEGVSVAFDKMNKCKVSFTAKKLPSSNKYILKSCPLENGIYSFNYTSSSSYMSLSINITDEDNDHLYTYPLKSNSLISVFVDGRHLFLKLIRNNEVQSTATISSDKARFSICHLSSDGTFFIENHSY